MMALKSKIILPTEDEIDKRLQEIRLEREDFPNETILPEYEMNGVKVPIFLLMECFEGNIDEEQLKDAIERKDLSAFSDYECIHLLGDDLDFTNYVIKYTKEIISEHCRNEIEAHGYVAIEYIADNELTVRYEALSDYDVLFARYFMANKYVA